MFGLALDPVQFMIYLAPNEAEASTYSFFFLRNEIWSLLDVQMYSALKALTRLGDALSCLFFLTWKADVMAGATVVTLAA